MGCPKYMLTIPDCTTNTVSPVLVVLIKMHYDFWRRRSESPLPITLSVRDVRQQHEVEYFLTAYGLPQNMLPLYVIDHVRGVGPVAALVAAYEQDPHSEWLVTGCDYPLITSHALQLLTVASTSETNVVCFKNNDGYREPLLALWDPTALSFAKKCLQHAMEVHSKLGPNRVLLQLSAKSPACVINLEPADHSWVTNMNTMQDWMNVCAHLKDLIMD